jgi:hypothetical protein
MAAPPCPVLGDGITPDDPAAPRRSSVTRRSLQNAPSDTLLHVARFLSDPTDLLRLQLTCRRFANKVIAAPVVGGGGAGNAAAAAAPEMLSIPEEAARRWVLRCSEQEREWVSFRTTEHWLCLMHEVEVLRLPLAFGQAHASVTLTENGAVATKGARWDAQSAGSKVVMRSGRHFAQFTVLTPCSPSSWQLAAGVIRPGWDVGPEGGVNAEAPEDVDGHCFFSNNEGRCYPGFGYPKGYETYSFYINYHWWEGMQPAREPGDRIGMLLDLDQGSMTVWKNGEQLGVMVVEGLTGPLCWAVSMRGQGSSVRIESAPAPASPTEEQLAAAKAWQRRGVLGLPPAATDAECAAKEAGDEMRVDHGADDY